MPDNAIDHERCADLLREAIRRVDGRWKLPILANLYKSGKLRFSELERAIPEASQKMLTQHLRDLEEDGIVHRTVYPQVPPKVEYQLSAKGMALETVFSSLQEWDRKPVLPQASPDPGEEIPSAAKAN